MARWPVCFLTAVVVLAGSPAGAHDPSAYGGLFRSRDQGATWLNADAGLFLNAALTVAVDPRQPARLLLGTDLGVLRSENGGRSWTGEAASLIIGAVFALAFLPDGAGALAAAPGGVFRLQDGSWSAARLPDGALPARAIAFGTAPDRIYLAGRRGLLASADGGKSFRAIADNALAAATITGLAVATTPAEVLLVVADGALLASEDGGRHWRPRAPARAEGPLETVALDPAAPGRLWAGGAGRLYRSEDLGARWQSVGARLPEPGAALRGIAADPAATTLVVTTTRGMYRSEDGGASWTLKEGNLPIHLEAGPLARDPADPRTLYAVYSLMPFAEVWRSAEDGSNLLARADPVSLAGGAAFLALLALAGGFLVRWLARQRAALSRGSLP